ncbi:hypothetical protein D3C74_355860 [compost metagenome]
MPPAVWTACATPAGIHSPIVGGTAKKPCSVSTVSTPCVPHRSSWNACTCTGHRPGVLGGKWDVETDRTSRAAATIAASSACWAAAGQASSGMAIGTNGTEGGAWPMSDMIRQAIPHRHRKVSITLASMPPPATGAGSC